MPPARGHPSRPPPAATAAGERSDEEARLSDLHHKRDRLAERLRDLRRRLDDPPADQDAFELDLYSYDESLIVAADLLDVEVPKGARGEMSGEQRQVLEERLAVAGLDVRAAD